MKATCNPGGPGHHWVKARYKLDEYPKGMELFRTEWTNPFTAKKLEKTRVFIPSKVNDNRYLSDDYVANLYQVGSAELVRAWLEGDWSVVEGSFFDTFGARNIIEPFTVPKEWLRFRSMDWGSRAPFSVGWWAVASDDHAIDGGRTIPRGALVRYREWYGASSPNVGLKLTAEEVAHGIIGRSGSEGYAYTTVDPSLFAESGGPSLAERMMRGGLAGLRRGDNRRIAIAGAIGGWDQMRARIKGDGENPMLYVFTTCRDFIRTVPALQHDPDRPEDLDTGGEDHAADECRYACMSRPYVAVPAPPPKPDAYDVTVNPNGTVSYTDGFSVSIGPSSVARSGGARGVFIWTDATGVQLLALWRKCGGRGVRVSSLSPVSRARRSPT
jgi:hypothetical protein